MLPSSSSLGGSPSSSTPSALSTTSTATTTPTATRCPCPATPPAQRPSSSVLAGSPSSASHASSSPSSSATTPCSSMASSSDFLGDFHKTMTLQLMQWFQQEKDSLLGVIHSLEAQLAHRDLEIAELRQAAQAQALALPAPTSVDAGTPHSTGEAPLLLPPSKSHESGASSVPTTAAASSSLPGNGALAAELAATRAELRAAQQQLRTEREQSA
eukprot:RCo005468